MTKRGEISKTVKAILKLQTIFKIVYDGIDVHTHIDISKQNIYFESYHFLKYIIFLNILSFYR